MLTFKYYKCHSTLNDINNYYWFYCDLLSCSNFSNCVNFFFLKNGFLQLSSKQTLHTPFLFTPWLFFH